MYYKNTKLGLFSQRTNEFTKDIHVEGRNINGVCKEYNADINRAAKEIIPRGVRKNYTPYTRTLHSKKHTMRSQVG